MINKRFFYAYLLFFSLSASAEYIYPTCIRTLKAFSSVDSRSKEVYKIEVGSVLDVESFNFQEQIFVVSLGDKHWRINQKFIEPLPADQCRKAKPLEPPFRTTRYTVFTSIFANSGNSTFNNIKTKVPNPNSVSSLPNPIVDSIEKGAGYEIGSCLSSPIGKWKISGNYCASYISQKFKVSKRPNPTPPSDQISLAELSTEYESYQFQMFSASMDITGKLWGRKSQALKIGGLISAGYYIGEMKKFEYRTGTVFKAESNSISTGPSGTNLNFGLLTEYAYSFDTSNLLKSVGLRLDYKIDGETGLRLTFGF